MINRNKLFKIIIFPVSLLFFILVFDNCEKDDTDVFVSQAKIAVEYIRGENYMADLFGLLHSSICDSSLVHSGSGFVDSIFVIYALDTLTGKATFFYDFDDTLQLEIVREIYGGTVTANLNQPFEDPGATLEAVFDNFTIDTYLLQGSLTYQNTGETVDDSRKYLLGYAVNIIRNENKLLVFNPQRDLFWNEGFDTPYEVEDDEFILTGGATATYFNPNDPQASGVPIDITFTVDPTLGMACSNHFRHGEMKIILGSGDQQVELNGVFMDADLDNCADKVMIKNYDNSLGYPYYL